MRTVCNIARDVEPIAPPELSLDGAVSQDNLRAWVHALAGPELRGREAGTPDSLRAARLISEYFSSLGARAPSGSDHCMAFSARGIKDQNVIAHLPSAPNEAGRACGAILVGAHYDALGVDARGRVHPGADDNATGIAVLLELARLVATGASRPRMTLVIAAFGAEEKGLVGSQAYVANPSVPLETIALMINVDMAGRRPKGHSIIGYEASGPDRGATAGRIREAAKRASVSAIAMRLGERGDSVPFSKRVPTVFFSTTVHADYHRPTDTPERVDYAQVESALRLVLEIVESYPCEGTERALPPTPG